jgi:hypothetical protein
MAGDTAHSLGEAPVRESRRRKRIRLGQPGFGMPRYGVETSTAPAKNARIIHRLLRLYFPFGPTNTNADLTPHKAYPSSTRCN